MQADIEREEINRQVVSRDELLFFLRQFMDGDPNDPAYRRRLVDTFINSIWLYDDKIVFTYNYSGEGNTVTLDMIDAAVDESENKCSNNACQAPPKPEEALIFSRLLLFMPVRMKWRKRGIRKTTRIEGMRSI